MRKQLTGEVSAQGTTPLTFSWPHGDHPVRTPYVTASETLLVVGEERQKRAFTIL